MAADRDGACKGLLTEGKEMAGSACGIGPLSFDPSDLGELAPVLKFSSLSSSKLKLGS